MNAVELSVIWRARHETAAQNAVRLSKLLTVLAEIDECFGQWYKQGNSRKAASRAAWQMPPDIEELARVFEKANHRNLAGEITDMAFSAWNGDERDKPVSIHFMGNMAIGGNLLLPNRFELSIPRLISDGDPLPVAMCRKMLRAAVEAWDADFGSISYFGSDPPIGATIPRPRFWSGWMSYFPASLAKWFTVPPGILVEDDPDGGRLIQLTAEPFDKENPAHEAVADAMYRTLAAAFERLPPFGEPHIPATYAMLGWEYPPQTTAP